MRVMLVAGEASGDTHGAALISGLQAHHPDADLFGVGGPRMFQAGLRLYATLDDFQVHGLVEVVRHLPRLYGLLATLKDALEQERPDALVCIDYPGFNLKLAAHAQTLGIPVVFFNTSEHPDYHTPEDTWDRIEYEALTSITILAQRTLSRLDAWSSPLPFHDGYRRLRPYYEESPKLPLPWPLGFDQRIDY